MISFTFGQLIGGIVSICGLITAVAAVIALITNAIKKAKAPNQLQDERIENLEKKLEEIEKELACDYKRFEKIGEGNRIMQRCMLALLQHGIDGNDIETLKAAKNDLNEYLIRG